MRAPPTRQQRRGPSAACLPLRLSWGGLLCRARRNRTRRASRVALTRARRRAARKVRRSKELGRPDAVYEIVRDLAKLADAPDFEYGPAAVVFNKQRHRRGQRHEHAAHHQHQHQQYKQGAAPVPA